MERIRELGQEVSSVRTTIGLGADYQVVKELDGKVAAEGQLGAEKEPSKM